MSSPTASTILSSPMMSTMNDIPTDFQAFQTRTIIKDFRLSAELFASNGDVVLICGKEKQEKQGILLVAYEVQSRSSGSVSNDYTPPLSSSVRLLKVVRINKKTVTQLETVPIIKLALLLGDGVLSLLHIDSFIEMAAVPLTNLTLFSSWYDSTIQLEIFSSVSNSNKLTKPSISIDSPEGFTIIDQPSLPNVSFELRLAATTTRRKALFYSWYPQQKRLVENKEPNRGVFELWEQPKTLALSKEKMCVGSRKSYIIWNIATGQMENEILLSNQTPYEPIIIPLQEHRGWCIQVDSNTVFLDTDFSPMYQESVTIWKEIPSSIVQSSPYILALMPNSIDVCAFIPQGIKSSSTTTSSNVQRSSLSSLVQSIPYKNVKGHLWMDLKNERIYASTATDVVLVEPVPVRIQLQNYAGLCKYDLALTLIKAVLGSNNNNLQGGERTKDGQCCGNIDRTTLSKELSLINSEQPKNSEKEEFNMENSPRQSRADSQKVSLDQFLWEEYYKVGVMYGFQLFHRQQFEQSFERFIEYLADPCEIIILFPNMSAERWLCQYHLFNQFVQQHRHFSPPTDLLGVKLENALKELQNYLTHVRSLYLKILRYFNQQKQQQQQYWIEVQSLMKNQFILKNVKDLLVVVDTALLKCYLLDNNNTLVNALLRVDNNCLQSEVEYELKKHRKLPELISFYEKYDRHREALDLIIKMNQNNTSIINQYESIIKYLKKLNNDYLLLIFEYIEPIVKIAVNNNDKQLKQEILNVFIEDTQDISNNSIRLPITPQIRSSLDCLKICEFLEGISYDFYLVYLDYIKLRDDIGSYRREIHNRWIYAYCQYIKQLYEKLKLLTKQHNEQNIDDNDLSTSFNSIVGMKKNDSADLSNNLLTLRRQLIAYEDKVKTFLLDPQCQCDYDKLEAYFLKENNDNNNLFSLNYGIVLGKLSKHEQALNIFIQNGYYTDAENYCEQMYNEGDIILARKLYQNLLEWYLMKTDKEHNEKTIIRIINKASERLDPIETLKILPDCFELKNVRHFLEESLQTCLKTKRTNQLQRNLLFLQLLQMQKTRIQNEYHSFTIKNDTKCDQCDSPISAKQVIIRFPQNHTVHLHCRTKYEKKVKENQYIIKRN